MIQKFRTYNLAVAFYQICLTLCLEYHLKDQLSRAASSVALNLAEGAGRYTRKEKARFFQIAFGSLRECQAILDLADDSSANAKESADVLAAHLFQLIRKQFRNAMVDGFISL